MFSCQVIFTFSKLVFNHEIKKKQTRLFEAIFRIKFAVLNTIEVCSKMFYFRPIDSFSKIHLQSQKERLPIGKIFCHLWYPANISVFKLSRLIFYCSNVPWKNPHKEKHWNSIFGFDHFWKIWADQYTFTKHCSIVL